MTKNFEVSEALIDSSEKVSDQEVVDMAHWVAEHEGIFIGSSSSLNLVAACRVAKTLPDHSTLVTIICDSGHRHLSRFWNAEFISSFTCNSDSDSSNGSLVWPKKGVIPLCLQ